MSRFSQPSFPVDPVLWLWSLIGHAAMPWLYHHAHRRLRQGKETVSRLPERFGHPGLRKPSAAGPLLWLHAASVGESRCVLPVAERLLSDWPELTILMTTATLTGGQTVISHPAVQTGRLVHQLIPYDVPCLLDRFLSYWRPIGLVLTESELWPGLLCLCQKRQLPVMLVNGRLSFRSARYWQLSAPLLHHLLRPVRWVVPRSPEDARAFSRFGLKHRLLPPADLKEDAPPLPFNREEAMTLRQKLGSRPVFVAASTHPGEEEIIIAATREAHATRPDLLTIIIPRHPERGAELAGQTQAPRRSAGQSPAPHDTLWIADTLGEVGLFLQLAERVLIGNSLLAPGGGHNPLEPLRFRRPTAIGPYMQNWNDLCTRHAASLHPVKDAASLARWLKIPSLPRPRPLHGNHAIIQAACHIKDTVKPDKAHK